MEISTAVFTMYKFAGYCIALLLVAHLWLAVTVVRLGEPATRRYLSAMRVRPDSVLGKVMLRIAAYGIRV